MMVSLCCVALVRNATGLVIMIDDTKYCDAIAEQVRVSDKFKLEVGRDRRGRTFNVFEYSQCFF